MNDGKETHKRRPLFGTWVENSIVITGISILFLLVFPVSTEVHSTRRNTNSPPGSVDNSRLSSFPPIRSQLDLGSCVAWAIVYYQYSHEYALLRGWNISDGDSSRIFSPKWGYNLTNNGVDNGSSPQDVFRLLQDHGAATLADVPYDTNHREWPTSPEIWESALRFRAADTRTFKLVDSRSGMKTLRALLDEGHTPVFRTKIGSWKYGTTADDPDDPHDDSLTGQEIAWFMDGTKDGHALAIVGYNDHVWVDINRNSAVDPAEKGAYLVVNSWGPSFSREGLVWVAYDAVRARTEVADWSPPGGRRALIIGREVYLTTPHLGYIPRVTARITPVHSERNQIGLSFRTSPEIKGVRQEWTPIVFALRGGEVAFDGSQARTASPFVLDLTPIALPETAAGTYTLEMRDTRPGAPLEITDFSVHFGGADTSVHFPVPQYVEDTVRYTSITFQSNKTNRAPTAKISPVIVNGKTAPCALRFDASSSHDPDGDSLLFTWQFDDSEYAGGEIVNHLLPTAGSHTVRLTVGDIHGAQSSATTTFELDGMPENAPPEVNAGPDRYGHPNRAITLFGAISDDNLLGTEPTVRWEVLKNPGAMSISMPDSVITGFVASDTGEYVLALTADDGDVFVEDYVQIFVLPDGRNLAPFVMLPADTTIEQGTSLHIGPRIEDDGLPNGRLESEWEYVWGTDAPTFTAPYAETTEVQALQPGRHTVRLSVTDGDLSTHDDMNIEVVPATQSIEKVRSGRALSVQVYRVGRHYIRIHLNGDAGERIKKASITDMRGRRIATLHDIQSAKSGHGVFAVEISPGGFIFRAETGTRVFTQRFIIHH